jgi:hypothetical protein
LASAAMIEKLDRHSARIRIRRLRALRMFEVGFTQLKL